MADIAEWNRTIIEAFRASGGHAAGPFRDGTLLLLHHRGRRSGTERVSPLIYQRVGEAYAIFASASGAPSNPAWYHNLMADPATTVEVGSETLPVVAREVTGAERDAIWERQKQIFPQYQGYQDKTDRTIPVVLLDPAA